MGQAVRRILEDEGLVRRSPIGGAQLPMLSRKKFPDLNEIPPEISLAVLSHLNATDLCLAACVWQSLAADEVLWHGLCKSQWSYATVYEQCRSSSVFSYRQLYMRLDEGTLTFNADAFAGMDYFFKFGLVDDSPMEIAQFFHQTRSLNLRQMMLYLDARRSVLDRLIELQNFANQFLPNALRAFLRSVQAPNERNNYLQALLEKFSARFCQCNPHLGLTCDTVYILCFSLILLSVDLSSPHVKNKMSKREFIRNVRNAVQRPDDELAGHLYDNVYLRGHVAPCPYIQ